MLTYDSRPTPASSTKSVPPSHIMPATVMATPSQNIIPNSEPHQPKTAHHHIWLVTGPAGCGKSTVAEHIAKAMKLPFIEGDNLHPPANIEKMAHGVPLTDSDRWDWLTLLREEALRQLSAGSQGVVLTCSALKKKYRDVIRVAPYQMHDALIHFIFLHADEKVLLQRVQARQGHYMGANMVHSQFDILEMPTADETDVLSIDVSRSIEQIEAEALAVVQEAVQAELIRDSTQ